MTFPYPLTPEVRADLWRFFSCDPPTDSAPDLPDETFTRAGDALTNTPFARAFVAWREERAETERPLPPISTLAMDLLLHNKVTP